MGAPNDRAVAGKPRDRELTAAQMALTTEPAQLMLNPNPGQDDWAGKARRHRWRLDGHAQAARDELGLDRDIPVIMTGHQAEWWHPGIVAKFFAADRLAELRGGVAAWIIVDQDDNDPGTLRYPVVVDQQKLAVRDWRLDSSGLPLTQGRPVGRRMPLVLSPPPILPEAERFAASSVKQGLARIDSALRATAASSASDQVIGALERLLNPHRANHPKPRVLSALSLERSTAFRGLVERMADDPRSCVEHYNTAVRENPRAGIAPLDPGETVDRCELPLWRIADIASAPRSRATVADVREWLARSRHSASRHTHDGGWTLAPRALLMTGFLRTHLCDLFIHGVGGGRYDPITERWLRAWLKTTLAPTVTISATMHLEIDTRGLYAPTLPEVSRARWVAHHARHDPAMLGDRDAAARKADLVARMRRLTHGQHGLTKIVARQATSDLYRQLQKLLSTTREQHRDALELLDQAAVKARTGIDQARIVSDRTWCFALYEPEQIDALRTAIDQAVF